MIKFFLPCLLAAALPLVLASCQATGGTPYSESFSINHRIKKHLNEYEKLPEDHKASVRCGEISEGMPKVAVFLAWGEASQVVQSSQNGQVSEQWVYFATESVPYHSVGYGGAVFGPSSTNGSVNVGTEVLPINQLHRSADFVDGKVVAWRRVR